MPAPPGPVNSVVLLVRHRSPRRQVHIEALQGAAMLVELAGDVDQWSDDITRHQPNLVLFDAHGSSEGCFSALTEFVRLTQKQTLPIVVLLDAEGRFPVQQALELGVAEFVESSAPPALLAHRLRRVIAESTRENRARGPHESPVRSGIQVLADRSGLIEKLASAFRPGELPQLPFTLFVMELRTATDDDQRPHGKEWSTLLKEALRIAMQDHLGGGAPDHWRMICAAHMGPSRIAIAISGCAGIQEETEIGLRLREVVDDLAPGIGGDTHVSAEVGISGRNDPEESLEAVLARAETACYCARSRMGNGVQHFNEYMGRWASERRKLERDLRGAVERNELVVYYQPRVDAQTRKVLAFEALVRWIHPELGLVSPGQFIPLAEESGLIEPIGEWVLEEACRQNRHWQEVGFAPVRVAVNLSPVQFRDPELSSRVQTIVGRTGLENRWLELEITESMLMNDPRTTSRTLTQLKSSGISLSIDDFGTGYSSLAYLRRFPIDALKIDRSFIRQVTSNPDDAAIATAIILMGHSLKLKVVAEGVETESQLSFLQVLQCNEIQGYLVSPPAPAENVEHLLERLPSRSRAAG